MGDKSETLPRCSEVAWLDPQAKEPGNLVPHWACGPI